MGCYAGCEGEDGERWQRGCEEQGRDLSKVGFDHDLGFSRFHSLPHYLHFATAKDEPQPRPFFHWRNLKPYRGLGLRLV